MELQFSSEDKNIYEATFYAAYALVGTYFSMFLVLSFCKQAFTRECCYWNNCSFCCGKHMQLTCWTVLFLFSSVYLWQSANCWYDALLSCSPVLVALLDMMEYTIMRFWLEDLMREICILVQENVGWNVFPSILASKTWWVGWQSVSIHWDITFIVIVGLPIQIPAGNRYEDWRTCRAILLEGQVRDYMLHHRIRNPLAGLDGFRDW